MQNLVSTQWLQDHLQDDDLRIVDIRGHVIPASEPHPHYFSHREDYQTSHIPGAVFVDWVLDITNPASPNKSQIATPEAYAALMGKLGVDADTLVVVYDDANSMFSARLWWSLHYYGHTNVTILDGGWNKWMAEDRPITEVIPQIIPKQFIPKINDNIRWTVEQVEATLNDPNTILIDVRSVAEFAGQSSRAKRGGHIPGAVNLPRPKLVNKDGTVPDAPAIQQILDGIDTDKSHVVIYCNGGVSASYGMLALTEAGIKNLAVYDGSWKEWGNDETKPIE